ncbi:CHAT domain-containing protein [Kouleothrix sp.]|uniref:CHAT domain-containing protein n=1 Tax=Kouleothrix sp. TaxID=2779161 RepID=UPI0039195CA2
MSTQASTRPLRMLALIAAPLVQRRAEGEALPIQPLNTVRELEGIIEACKLADTPVAIDIQTEIATTEALGRAFGSVQGSFDLVHFSGHGAGSADGAALVLEDTADLGAARLVDAAELGALLGPHPCRLAFLSACHSEGLAAALIGRGVAHVVAINADDAILDLAAQALARCFYSVLLSGRSVQEAFDRAVQAVRSDDALRKILDPHTLQPVNLAEALKFRLLPDNDQAHAAPLARDLPQGEARFRRPPWNERTNLSNEPRGAIFVGRQREIHHITGLLRSHRCVSITGFGGMGKTALAEAAGRWQHERARWPDGVVLVELRAVQRAADARGAIARALTDQAHIVAGDQAKIAESNIALAQALRDLHMLLILDDVDALIEADPTGLTDILRQLLGTRALRLLLTSRHSVTQQIVHRTILLPRLVPEEAFVAFRSYAPPDSWGKFTDVDRAALPELLQLLDGYPFPIRLAAAYLQQQGCGIAGLVQKLRKQPHVPMQYQGEQANRETSLVATLNLSYQALPLAAQQLLPVLALFPAGLSRTAARAILGTEGVDLLETLTRYALAERREDPLAFGAAADDHTVYQRFILPEPARWYAEGHQQPGLLDQYAPAALEYFHRFIGDVDTQISGHGKAAEGRQLLAIEQPNWRRFLDWGYTNEQTERSCLSAQATGRLGNYWTLTGEQRLPAISERLQHALAAARRLHDRAAEANVLQAIGDVQQFRDDRDAALTSYTQALALYREIGDRLGEANVLRRSACQQFRDDPRCRADQLHAGPRPLPRDWRKSRRSKCAPGDRRCPAVSR